MINDIPNYVYLIQLPIYACGHLNWIMVIFYTWLKSLVYIYFHTLTVCEQVLWSGAVGDDQLWQFATVQPYHQ